MVSCLDGATMRSMRYVSMQILTWGTIAGAAGSALLLAALGGAGPRQAIDLSIADAADAFIQVRAAEPAKDVEPPPARDPKEVGER